VSTPTVSNPTSRPARPLRPAVVSADGPGPQPGGPTLHIVPWVDPVADPHGVDPCSRYVELYWLGIIGPSTTAIEPMEMPGHGRRVSHPPP